MEPFVPGWVLLVAGAGLAFVLVAAVAVLGFLVYQARQKREGK